MTALMRIYQKIYQLEQSETGIAMFCTKHLGITTEKAFREFYTPYENWRIKMLKPHRDSVMEQKRLAEQKHRQAFSNQA
jgi:hypothetical protein